MRLAMTSVKMLTLVAGMCVVVASKADATEGLQPILLTTSQVCGCSPAAGSRLPGSGWTRAGGSLQAEFSGIPVGSPMVAPRPQTPRPNVAQNIALKPITIAQSVPFDGVVPSYQGYSGYQTVRVLRPVVPESTPPYGYRLGKGLIGQPKLYVPGQPIRNFIRYLSP